jgi:hypothetical protein
MVCTVVDELGTDWRFQVAFVLLGVAISIAVGLITERLSASGLGLSVTGLVLGGAKYRHERPSSNR